MLIEWHEEMSVGVSIIDEEHKKLISFLNTLYDAIEQGRGKEILNKTLMDVLSYTTYHFCHEELLFSPTAYPDKEHHTKEHARITNRLMGIHSKLRLGEADELCIELMVFLKEWLIDHILTVDMNYAAYIKEKNANNA